MLDACNLIIQILILLLCRQAIFFPRRDGKESVEPESKHRIDCYSATSATVFEELTSMSYCSLYVFARQFMCWALLPCLLFITVKNNGIRIVKKSFPIIQVIYSGHSFKGGGS